MKIGIVSSWNEWLTLFKFLNKFDHEYFVYYDQINRPYWDNEFDYSVTCIKKWIEFLQSKWVDKIILPPVYELYFLQQEKFGDMILPLFKNYVLNFTFHNSLVGKIWLFWDYADIEVWQDLLYNLSKKHILTKNQTNIKKFNFPFKFWAKEVQMRKYFSRKLSFSNLMVNKIIKLDLRYFKDANIDSLVPLNYEYFNYQNTIFKFFNYKKQKFHKIDNLEKVFIDCSLPQSDLYSIEICFNWHVDFIKREKNILWLLQKWKSVDIIFNSI